MADTHSRSTIIGKSNNRRVFMVQPRLSYFVNFFDRTYGTFYPHVSSHEKNVSEANLDRVVKAFDPNLAEFLVAHIYFDRFANSCSISSYTDAALAFNLALFFSIKYNEDKNVRNKMASNLLGISRAAINSYEIEFLRCIRFNIGINSVEFQSYLRTFSEGLLLEPQAMFSILTPDVKLKIHTLGQPRGRYR